MEIHPSQRRISCEVCRRSKVKCQRIQPEDPKCVRCTLTNVLCDSGQQRKVGRPKRDESALSPTSGCPPLPKRRKRTTNPRSRPPAVHNSNDYDTPWKQNDLAFPDAYGSTRSHAEENGVPRQYANSQDIISTSTPKTSDQDWLGWPTIMTDRWCHKMIPAAAAGRILTDPESGSPPNAQVSQPTAAFGKDMPNQFTYDTTPALLAPMDQALFQGSLAWISPDFLINPRLSSNYGLTRKKDPLPFGINRPPTYYVHPNSFSSNQSGVATTDVGVDGSGAMVKLLSIVYGLRLRSTLVHNNRSKMNLSLLIHRKGPLFIGSHSLAEYVMDAAQELVQIVSILLGKPGRPHTSGEQLSACLLSTITDIYCRLLSFFELFLEHLTDRAERYSADPVIPIPGLRFNGTILTGPCTQGVLFSSSCFHLLGRLGKVLGLDSMSGSGLLSTNQIEALCNKLDGSNDLVQSRGIMRPADVTKLYAQVATVLEQLSSTEP